MDQRMLKASADGDISTIMKLLRLKCKVNVRDEHGVTALAKAAEGGHTAVVKILLEAGATTEPVDGVGVSALHRAALNKQTNVVQSLVRHGADLVKNNKDGFTPIDFTDYKTELWDTLHRANKGIIPPEEVEISDVPVIPEYAIKVKEKKSKTGKKGKKGKKGGKKGKKGKKKKK